jgi:O-antigen/teichoic acid export membrane protein
MYVAIITFACVFTLAAVAEPLMVILVGEKWLPSVKLLRIMSLYAAIYPLSMLNLNVLNLRKKSGYLLRLEVIKKVLFVPVIVVGCFFSLEVMLWTAVGYYYIEFFINGWYSRRLIGYGVFRQVKDLSGVYLISGFVAAAAYLLTLLPVSYGMMLSSQLLLSFLLYLIIYKMIRQPEFAEMEAFCRSKFCKR